VSTEETAEKQRIPEVTMPMQPVSARVTRRFTGLAAFQRLIALAVALSALVVLVFLFSPRVTVVVTPTARSLERTLVIPLPAVAETNTGVPVRLLETDVEVSASTPATGRRQQGVTAATGTVILFNETEEEITVPAGTIVATDGGQRFEVTDTVRVPARQAEFFMNVPVGIKAGQVEVGVRALALGSVGNVAAGRITSLPEGPSGLRVVNPESTRGGTERTVSYATEDDIETLRRQLSSKLRLEGEKLLESNAGAGAYLIGSWFEVQETEFSARPAAGETAESVYASMKGRARGRYVLIDDVRRYARTAAEDFVPTGYSVLGSPAVFIEEESKTDDGRQLKVAVRVVVSGSVDEVAVSRLVAGRSPEQARRVLLETGEVGDMQVSGRPRKRLPSWTPWIRVVVAAPGDHEAEVVDL
jgi:hypothetical protein